MCELREKELSEIERMIFKYLWNKKWVGTVAPDRIKRATLKQAYKDGGIEAPDIRSLNKALKTRQFIRAMNSKHPINLIQKFQLERLGYDEYYKCEYAKICNVDNVIRCYQLVCNELTDYFRDQCYCLPIPDPDSLNDVINVIASTDVLEYFMRKNKLMFINLFGQLLNYGVTTVRDLINEEQFPRNDRSGALAKYLLHYFPRAWREVLTHAEDINSDVTYESEYPSHNFKLIDIKLVSVRSLRRVFQERLPIQIKPYTNFEKFELENIDEDINPFLHCRKVLHLPSDRFFKYRILQGDIFCNVRMYKFKMVNSPLCSFCGREEETIKHLMWDCTRSKNVWDHLNQICRRAYNVEYVNYHTVLIGHNTPIYLMDVIIVKLLRLIFSIDRSTAISVETIDNTVRTQYKLEKWTMRKCKNKFIKRWQNLNGIFHLFDHDGIG